MKKRFSLIVAVIFSICFMSFFNVINDESTVQYADMSIVVNPPVIKAPGKKTKTVIPPTKRRVSTPTYRTMA